MRSRLLLIIVGLCLFTAAAISAQNFSYWQDAQSIRSLTLQAQAELLSAPRSDTPDLNYQNAAGYIAQAQELYDSGLQVSYADSAADADAMISDSLAEAQDAAAQGDSARLAAASWTPQDGVAVGQLYTGAGYAGKRQRRGCLAWLQLREFRQPTRVSPVDNQARWR